LKSQRIDLAYLPVKEVFHLVGEETPYSRTIEELKKLTWETSPLAKVDLVYNALKYQLAEEVDLYLQDHIEQQRNIDIDNLQGITIYIVWAMQKPTIIVDCFLTAEFLSRSTKVSTRTMFLKVLQSSIDFLLEMGPSEQPKAVEPTNLSQLTNGLHNPTTPSPDRDRHNDSPGILILTGESESPVL
jgi:hypothetical protein